MYGYVTGYGESGTGTGPYVVGGRAVSAQVDADEIDRKWGWDANAGVGRKMGGVNPHAIVRHIKIKDFNTTVCRSVIASDFVGEGGGKPPHSTAFRK